MDSVPIADCTPSGYWLLALTYVLPPVGALLSATALWVASRARGTSQVALLTSLVPQLQSGEPVRSSSGTEPPPAVPDQRK